MRCLTLATAGCSLLSLLVPAAVPLQAQDSVAQVCLSHRLDAARPADAYWLARHPAAVAESLAMLEAEGRWEESMSHIATLYKADERFFLEEMALRPLYAHLRDSVASAVTQLSAALGAREGEVIVNAQTFRVLENPDEPGVEPGFTLLNQRALLPMDATPDQARSICWTSHSMFRLMQRLNAPARLADERMLRERVGRWDSFNDRGLTPFPWELVLNEAVGWLGREPLEPPQWQLIAFRPSPAIELDDSFGSRVNVLALDVLGVAYYPPSRRWYVGASGLLTSPSESAAGWGVMLRSSWAISGGPVWRDVDGTGRKLRWVVALDAYDLLSGAPKVLRDAAARATGGRADG